LWANKERIKMRKTEIKNMKELIIPEEELFSKFGIEGGVVLDSIKIEPPLNKEDGLANKIIVRYYN